MPYSVKGFFEINEDMVQILLMLEVLFTQNSKVEDLFCGASSGSEPSLFFSNYFFSLGFQPIQDDFQHDFARMTDEADSSVVLAELQVALFRDPDVACTFQATIGGKFAPLIGLSDEDMDMDTMITTYNTAVTDAASEILGKERRRKKPWFTKDVLDLCDERRDLKKKRYEAEGAKEYREANRRIQKAVKKAKEDWIGAQCEEIETCLNKNNSKRAYQLVKDLTSEKQGRSSTIQDKSGKCLTEEKEILSRWTEYCSELYNYESCGDNTVLDCSQPPEEDLQPILREEVEIAVASLKKGKSAGVDNIPAELVQAGGETMTDVLTEICNRIWRTGEWPTPWAQSLSILGQIKPSYIE